MDVVRHHAPINQSITIGMPSNELGLHDRCAVRLLEDGRPVTRILIASDSEVELLLPGLIVKNQKKLGHP